MHSSDSSEFQSNVAERYRALLDIGRTLAGTLSKDELYAAIHQETARVLDASGFYISLYDQARDLATIVYYADRGEMRRVDVTYRGSDSEVIRERAPTIVADDLNARSLMLLGEEHTDVTRSAVSAPLLDKGRVVGAISAQSYEANAYTDDDLGVLVGFGANEGGEYPPELSATVSNLAFPLLKVLTEEGDLQAKKVFKEEIIFRY